MNLQQAVQPRSSSNGFGRRRVEREMGTRLENKLPSGKINPSKTTHAGLLTGSKGGECESPARNRLVYLTTCLIGHHVDVQVKNGSIYSGIFHATNAKNDFGIILKMARLTKDCSFRGQKSSADSVGNAPSKTFIIPATDLVQVIAKDVSVTRDGFSDELREKQQELMLDSFISHSRHVEMERELERWVPDEDDPQCPELDNIFDGPWNSRSWDQFQTNEALFGVKSTFDEELYTTKLERGPQMRDLEREALRLAREIEGEETQDLHLAEERGNLNDNFDFDEETRFSSVFRGVDDCGYVENEDILLDSHNSETFGPSSVSNISKTFNDLTHGKSNDGVQVSTCSSSVEEAHPSQLNSGRDLYRSGSNDMASSVPAFDGESRILENQFSEQHGENNYPKEFVEKQMFAEEAQTTKSDDSTSSLNAKKDGSDKMGLSPNATAYAPSRVPIQENMTSSSELPEPTVSGKAPGETQNSNSRGRPGSSTSSTSECIGVSSASTAAALSPSSSMGSLSSEKSTLNPNAKEFKLNPNAKSFTPTQTTARPPSPVTDGSFYYPGNVSAVPHMHGMPVNIGIGPSFPGHLFNPQAAPVQSPQAYFHPNGPQFGQQMILGHPRQVVYMPSYPPEMPYKGRDY